MQQRTSALSALLNASATQAGALISNNRFEVPQFQREYSWEDDQVSEFWSDLRCSVPASGGSDLG
ncbi:MAG: DUF262 domain-containing protein [Sphingomonadales bacterium]|nr:MAG: DUF262 domain-containing protein [Sphingomonadales bacterium]